MDSDSQMTGSLISSFRAKHAKASAFIFMALSSVAITGCTPLLSGASTGFDRLAPGEAPTVVGPAVRNNFTPINPALACLANELQRDNKPRLTIAVDDIRDYTGQYNINEGDAITQGGALMVMSALGKLGGTVNVADRFNTDVAQMELSFMNQRELGDGTSHYVGDGRDRHAVPWLPYYGGTIMASQYYITGGITELNYNIQSGGAQFSVNQIGAKDRVYTEDVAIDLELVDTSTLLVVKTISLAKQITGFEVGAGIFQFFGSNLWDINIGNKSQEPQQLAVRSLLEDGTLRLVAAAYDISPASCLAKATNWIPDKTADQFLKEYHEDEKRKAEIKAAAHAQHEHANKDGAKLVNAGDRNLDSKMSSAPVQNGLMLQAGGDAQIKFNYGSSYITGADIAVLDKIRVISSHRPVQVVLVVPANEVWSGSRRQKLLQQRVEALRHALRIRGIMNVAITWAPRSTQTGIVMDGSGFQKIAVLRVSQ